MPASSSCSCQVAAGKWERAKGYHSYTGPVLHTRGTVSGIVSGSSPLRATRSDAARHARASRACSVAGQSYLSLLGRGNTKSLGSYKYQRAKVALFPTFFPPPSPTV